MQSIEQTKNDQNTALTKRMRMYFQTKPNKEVNMTKKVLFRMSILIGLLAVVALAVLAQTTTSARVGEDPMTAQRLAGSDYIERHPSKYYVGSGWIERYPGGGLP